MKHESFAVQLFNDKIVFSESFVIFYFSLFFMVTRLGNKVAREVAVMCSLTILLNGISVFLAALLLTSLMLV